MSKLYNKTNTVKYKKKKAAEKEQVENALRRITAEHSKKRSKKARDKVSDQFNGTSQKKRSDYVRR